MKKVLICNRSSNPLGGVDRIVRDLCHELPSRGWEVILGLAHGTRFNDANKYLEVLADDLPSVQFDGTLGTRPARINAIRKVIRSVQPEIVLVTRLFDAYEATRLEKKQEDRGPRLIAGIRSYERALLYDCLLYRDSLDGCVTSGELVAQACRQLCHLEDDRVISIGGGIHPPVKPRDAAGCRTPIRLGYAGRLDQVQKRIMDLADFVRVMEARDIKFELTIAGTGTEESALKERLADQMHTGKVKFLGWLSREQLYVSFYPQLDCFVHFAAWEGMTISPREAMAHGVVPIISRFSGLKTEGQFLENETALTFDVGDIDTAVDCLRRLIESPEMFSRLSANAARSQSGVLSYQGALDAWSRFFQYVIESPIMLGTKPPIRSRINSRLGRMGVSAEVETWIRRLLKVPVVHHSPGSEWPTASRHVPTEFLERFKQFPMELEETLTSCSPTAD